MTLTTDTPPPVDEEAQTMPTPTGTPVRKTRCNVAGTSMLAIGPQANPRRIRLTSPGNPVHR
jgi:hypothetical protein